ncbi:MAG: MFS transporter [Calditrichaeota bacterium]|nr:MFS transporter [Calditrichota bacterium]
MSLLVYFGCFFIALGSSLVTPSVMAAVSMRSREHEQGVAMGVTQNLGSLGRIIGPPYGGLTYARINFYFPFLSAAAAALATLGIYTRPGPKPGGADELAITGMEKKKQITISN